jgi:hypothetical protein
MDDTPIPITPRPLSIEERSILARLLEFDFPGSQGLRARCPSSQSLGSAHAVVLPVSLRSIGPKCSLRSG